MVRRSKLPSIFQPWNSPVGRHPSEYTSNRYQTLREEDISVAGQFSEDLSKRVLTRLEGLVFECFNEFATENYKSFQVYAHWFDESWQVISFDSDYFRFGMFLDPVASSVHVIIDDYFEVKRTRHRRASGKIKGPGQIRFVTVSATPTVKLDHTIVCKRIVEAIEAAYRVASIDYKSALRDYCLAAASDDLYDVLRKSRIPELIQKDITLYCVCHGMGRHLPSLDRVSEITSRLYHNSTRINVCPFRLATEFFLGYLDGRRYELYTHKAFREGQAVVAKKNQFSGESYVRLATETFFSYSEVVIQPIAKSGEEWLLSAIYPARVVRWVLPEIEIQKQNFRCAIERIQTRNRKTIYRLNQIIHSTNGGLSGVGLAGEFLGGFVKGLVN